jgi:hypothetical protein
MTTLYAPANVQQPSAAYRFRLRQAGGWLARLVLGLAFGVVTAFSGVSALQAQTVTPGSVAGRFSVNQNGAATYTLPIQVPPGISGMQPQLSLNYNSQSGSGLAGIGWSLGGLSVITRCEPTKAQEGAVGRVNLDDNDRYCLEGQKLILVSGVYGQDAAVYRTEIDKFSKVLGISRQGKGTAMFRVWTKSGQIMEYGGTIDSRVRGNPSNDGTVRQWSLNKVSDTSGNVMNITYWNSLDGNMHVPQAINYGANGVAIGYEMRPDPSKAYNVDQPLQELVRVLKITTQVGANLVKAYNFSYDVSASTKRSRLTQIKECDGLGTSCLKPVVFSYNEMDRTAIQIASAGHGDGGSGTKLVDLFGDGRPVYYTHGPTGLHYATRLKPDGTEQNWNWAGHGVSDAGWEIVDLFGDGKPVYWTHDTAGNHYASRFKADGTVQNWAWTVAAGNNGYHVGTSGVKRIVDIFGDGKPVYYTSTEDHHYASRFKADGTVQNWQWLNTGMYSTYNQYRCPHTEVAPDISLRPASGLFDLFGEGRSVFWMRCGNGSYVHQAIQFNENSTVTPYYWNVTDGVHGDSIHAGGSMFDVYENGRYVHWTRTGSGSGVHVVTQLNKDGTFKTLQYVGDAQGMIDYQFGDLFGDGHKVYWTQSGSSHFGVRMNKDGTVEKWTWAGHGRGTDDFRLVNLFGDGRQVYWTRTGATHFVTQFNDGQPAVNHVFSAGSIGDGGSDFADLYGDGRQVYWTRLGLNHYVSSFSRGEFDNLKVVTGSTGLKQSITHQSINAVGSASIYTADTGANAAVSPKRDIQFPMRVVSKVDSDNGLGSTNSSVYSYGGLKSEPNTGRGFLGFRWMGSTDATTSISQVNTFNQDFPYIGMLKSSETRLTGAGNAGLLRRSSITPGCKIPLTQTACAAAPATNVPGSLYFPYTSQSVDEAWDMNGAVLPTVTTNYDYGLTTGDGLLYGNLTNITATTAQGLIFKTVATANEYFPANTTNWILGRLKKSTVTHSGTDSSITTGNPILPPPTLTVSRLNGLPMKAPGTTGSTWSSTNATSVTYACTSSGTGFASPATSMGLSGSVTGPTQTAWIGYPSTCTWTATGQGGTATFVETLTTVAAPPTITFTRTPLPLVAGQNHSAIWSTTNATSVAGVCTSTGTGFTYSGPLALSGNNYSATSAAWVGYPTSCVWTATGPGGTATATDNFSTVAGPVRLPVYRVRYDLRYFHTTSVAERDWHITNWGAIYEGVPFYVHGTSNATAGLSPVYRYINTTNSTYFYTNNAAEIANMVNYPQFSYQGVAWYAQENNAANGAVPLYRYRWYDTNNQMYFYTTTPNSGGDYNIPDGSSQYVWTAP